MTANIFYVYLFLDPRNFYQPFYVGKGKHKRAESHLSSRRNNKFTNNIITAICETDQLPVIMYWSTDMEEAAALAMECELIARFGRRGIDNNGILTNRTLGGDGLSGHVFTDEHKQKISIAHKGKTVSEATRDKLSANRKGKTLSLETKNKLSVALKGKMVGDKNPMWGKTGALHPNYGKSPKTVRTGWKHSTEAITKMRESAFQRPAQPSGSKSPRAKKERYDFEHKSEEMFTGTSMELSELTGISKNQLYNLCRNIQRTCKGWSIKRRLATENQPPI